LKHVFQLITASGRCS